MALLPPTVGERLARCGTEVEVWGLVAGATIDLFVDAAQHTMTSSGSWAVFSVPGLNANQRVRARQTLGSEVSQDSPEVIVGEVALPPSPARLSPAIYRCAHCVYADGVAPGSTVTLLQSDKPRETRTIVATAKANRGGAACFGVSFGDGGFVYAQTTTCGQEGPLSAPSALVDAPTRLPAPTIPSPVFACQTGMAMNGLTHGAVVEVFSGAASFGTFCSCWGGVWVNLGRSLTTSDRLAAKQTLINAERDCNVDGDRSAEVSVAPPDERIKPALRPVLYEGDRLVRVQNQIEGGELHVLVTDDGSTVERDVGRVGSSRFEDVALNEPLVVRQRVRVKQTLCSHDEISDPLIVQARPAPLPVPVVRAPLYDCGIVVAVDGVLPGARVRLFQDGVPIGYAWSDGSTVVVRVGPRLRQGASITATQEAGGTASDPSSAVAVGALTSLPAPTVLPPVRVGDRSVRVGGIVPGATVQVFDGGVLVGTADAAEVVAVVTLSREVTDSSDLRARQALCGQPSPESGTAPEPHVDPSQPGPGTPSAPTETSAPDLIIPATTDLQAITSSIHGEITFPADPSNPGQVDPSRSPYPLVVVAHGRHNHRSPSYQGYRYLTSHLASHGMICLSIDLNDINGSNGGIGASGIEARGAVILEHIRVILARNGTAGDILQNRIDPTRIALVGHSRGGEAVVSAQVQNMSRPAASRYAIRGVVPIAPINALNLRHVATPLFVIYGSADDDVAGGSDFINPFLIYDHAETPKAMIFIHHARHNGFNEVWVRPGEENESILEGTISPAEHQAIAKAYILAFFQERLFGRSAYTPYIDGSARPFGLSGYGIHHQYQLTTRLPVDNFGDDDPQLSLPAEPISRDRNRLNLAVSYTNTSTTVWYDEEFRAVSQNPHDSRGVQLVWSTGEVYESVVGNRNVSDRRVLSLRIGQQYSSTATLNPVDQPQDAHVSLVTAGGSATVRIGTITDLPYPHVRPYLTKAALKTVRIPLSFFTAVNPAIQLTNVNAVRIGFSATPTGAVSIDDVEFSD
jgi:dienelactone hydrolase